MTKRQLLEHLLFSKDINIFIYINIYQSSKEKTFIRITPEEFRLQLQGQNIDTLFNATVDIDGDIILA